MAELSTAQRQELEELLADLQHDLGKYIKLPLSFLPAEAGAEEVRAALHQALRETRRSPQGTRSARSIWELFTAAAAAALTSSPGFAALSRTVEQALAWERLLDEPDAVIDRDRVTGDLGAITPAVRALIEELHGTP